MKKRVLSIVGLVRPWAITARAETLALRMANDYETTVVPHNAIPQGDWDIIHLHTPMALKAIAEREDLWNHPAWGFEVISERSNAHILTCSQTIKHAAFCVIKNPDLTKVVGGLPCGSTYIPNGVDFRLFCPRPIRVGWCGNKRDDSKEYKGVALIEQAVKNLAEKYERFVTIQFVMDPGDAPKRYATRSEMAEWYRTLDVYVNASIGEGCSNTILEALATGVPVVATGTGIAYDLQIECDLQIVDRTVEAIEAGIAKMIQPIIDRRALICREYTWKIIAKRYAEVYESVLQQTNGKE